MIGILIVSAVAVAAAWIVGWKNGHQAGEAEGYLRCWREHQQTSGIADEITASGRPQRGPDGRYVKRRA